eukprot:7850806-Lingulodinium_polyedra.AAC.1
MGSGEDATSAESTRQLQRERALSPRRTAGSWQADGAGAGFFPAWRSVARMWPFATAPASGSPPSQGPS